MVSAYGDLTVTVDFEASYLRYILARGSPYITLEISRPICLTFSCKSDVKSVSSSSSNTKHKLELENNQIWIIYSSPELNLKKCEKDLLKSNPFVGIIRVTITPNNKPKSEEILDLYKGCYATNGEAVFSDPFSLEYKWETKGWGDLLMLAHPLHLTLLSSIYNSKIRVLSNFKYKSIDGDLIGIVGNSWSLRAPNIPITWHSFRGVSESCRPEIVASLWRDVGALDSTEISTNHCLYYGGMIFRAARLAMIVEEVNCSDVIPAIRKFLRDTITPWLEGKFEGNGFVYESKWGEIVSKNGVSEDSGDYGFGLYNCNHAYLGNFVYASAVIVKLDSDWGEKCRGQIYDLVASYMCLGKKGSKSKCAKVRCFDFYKLHSWAKGFSCDGTNAECWSEIPAESMAAYYAASVLGMAYGDEHLKSLGSTLASFEIKAIKTWFHVRENRLSFVDSTEYKEIRVGTQVGPLLPVTEILFSDVAFARQVVAWAKPALARQEASDGWKAYLYALEATYDQENALKKIRGLKECLTNTLWWVHRRGARENFCSYSGKIVENVGIVFTVAVPEDFRLDLESRVESRSSKALGYDNDNNVIFRTRTYAKCF